MVQEQTLFPETADIETSSEDYATRFAGPTGEWMLEVQRDMTLSLLVDRPGCRVLDVGGGHGQLVRPLCEAGFQVTVLGSDESCRARIADLVDSCQCQFKVGNVIDLPYEANSFDVVICFRLLTHCEHWETLVKELCRVASQRVVVDYPTSQSLNAIAPMLFKAKKKIEKNTRTWRLFKHAEVRAAFDQQTYVIRRRRPQFFMPMVLHRALKSRGVSATMERICAALGLTQLAGSPVIMAAEPKPEVSA